METKTTLTLTREEEETLYQLVNYQLENLDEDDDRFGPTKTLLEKLT
jgi:hypothetical protein